MSAVSITLTWYELFLASQIGIRRQVAALQKKLPDKYGAKPDHGWQIHVEGAAGEMAAAKALGMYWSGSVNTFKVGGDVGSVQVRTRSRSDYDLIVRADDRDGDVFVLVVGASPSFDVVGWILGRDAKRSEWLRTHGGRPSAYFVPQEALSNIELLANQKVA